MNANTTSYENTIAIHHATAKKAEDLGFEGVASGPFVRSSYFAETLYADLDDRRRRL